MKMQSIFLLSTLVFFSLFSSCKKDDAPSNPVTGSRIKMYIEDATLTPYHRIDSFNISYDASNRITSMISTVSGGQFLYTYNAAGYSMDIKYNNALVIRQFAYVNNNQLVDSNFQYNDTGDSSTEKLVYNAANQLIQIKRYDYSLVNGAALYEINNYVYDNAGNIISQTQTDELGNHASVTTFTYNNVLNNVSGFNQPYFPKLQKYLVTSTTNSSGVTNAVYTYDNLTRVTTETDTDNTGNVVVKKYIYE